MKKTLNVNIGSMAFTIDEDAYHTLNGYYEDIRSRLYEEDKKEIMEDIETRTADIFREQLSFPMQVISIDNVKKAIAIIGSAQTFGEKKYDSDYNPLEASKEDAAVKKLYRSRTVNMLGGVCGGMAEYFKIDVTIIRLIMVCAAFLGGLGIFAYIVMWLIIPIEPFSLDIYSGTEDKKGDMS